MSDPGADKDKAQPRVSERIWEVITSLMFVGLLVFLGSLFGIGVLLWVIVTQLGDGKGMGLPLLALASVLLLLGRVVFLIFYTFNRFIRSEKCSRFTGRICARPSGVGVARSIRYHGVFSSDKYSDYWSDPGGRIRKTDVDPRRHTDDGGHFFLFRFCHCIGLGRIRSYLAAGRISDPVPGGTERVRRARRRWSLMAWRRYCARGI